MTKINIKAAYLLGQLAATKSRDALDVIREVISTALEKQPKLEFGHYAFNVEDRKITVWLEGYKESPKDEENNILDALIYALKKLKTVMRGLGVSLDEYYVDRETNTVIVTFDWIEDKKLQQNFMNLSRFLHKKTYDIVHYLPTDEDGLYGRQETIGAINGIWKMEFGGDVSRGHDLNKIRDEVEQVLDSKRLPDAKVQVTSKNTEWANGQLKESIHIEILVPYSDLLNL